MAEIERIPGIFRAAWCLWACMLGAGALPAADNCLKMLQAQRNPFDKAAVLIGVSKPKLFEGLRPVPGASADVGLLRGVFDRDEQFKGNVFTLVDDEAKTRNVRECLAGVGRLGKKGSTVVVYFTTRGFATDLAPDGFVVTADAALDKLNGAASPAPGGNGLTVNELEQTVGRMESRNRYLFLDLCREPGEKDGVENLIYRKILREEFYNGSGTRLIVTASTGTAPSYESHFAKALAAVPRAGDLNFDQLYEQVRDAVLAASSRKQKPASPGGTRVRSDCLLCRERLPLALVASATPMAAAEEIAYPAEWVKARIDAAEEEGKGQAIFVRYGEGNHFPGDPLQQCKTGTRFEGDYQLCKEEFDAAGAHFDEAARLFGSAPAEGDTELIASLEERKRFSKAQVKLLGDDAGGAMKELGEPGRFRFAESHNLLGIANLEQASYGEAEKQFRAAIEKAPYWAYPRHNLALTLVEHGAYEEAERAYREAIAMTPLGRRFKDTSNSCFGKKNLLLVARPYLYYNLGVLLQRLNRLGEAQREFCLAEASFQMVLDTLEKTGLDARRRVAADMNLADVKNSVGVVLQMRGKRKQAAAQFREALRMNEHLLAARFNLGRLQEKENREEARRQYQRVLDDALCKETPGELSCAAAKKALAELR